MPFMPAIEAFCAATSLAIPDTREMSLTPFGSSAMHNSAHRSPLMLFEKQLRSAFAAGEKNRLIVASMGAARCVR